MKTSNLTDNPNYQKEYYIKHREKKLSYGIAYASERTKEKREYDISRRLRKGDEINKQRKDKRILDKSNKDIMEYEMFKRAKGRAKRQNLPFNISKSDIVIPTICPVLGIELICHSARGGHDNSPSLDKIIPELGYVVGNIAVISSKANRIKYTANYEEILKVGNWLKHFSS